MVLYLYQLDFFSKALPIDVAKSLGSEAPHSLPNLIHKNELNASHIG